MNRPPSSIPGITPCGHTMKCMSLSSGDQLRQENSALPPPHGKEKRIMTDRADCRHSGHQYQNQIVRVPREYLDARFGHEWVQHPGGYSVYAPAGAEHYFTFMEGAIQRYPDFFIGAEPPHVHDLFES